MNLRLTNIEAKDLHDQIARLGTFMGLSRQARLADAKEGRERSATGHVVALSRKMNYQFDRSVYRDCKWCGGLGCLSCGPEADKEYRRQFPDEPKPLIEVERKDFDHFEISAATGGPSIEDAHGSLGVLLAKLNELLHE